MSFFIRITPKWIKDTYIAPLILAKLRERRYTKKYYTESAIGINPPRKQVIFMIDGRFTHGGLCDRLWGAISTYLTCKRHNFDFRIHWIYPFNITTFLQPAGHDWRINPEEISYNRYESSPAFVNNNHNANNQTRLLDRIAKKNTPQVHVYSPAHTDRENFGKNFAELFKPSPVLQSAIDEQLKAIGGDFVSITFRFQQLLGDFKEGNYRTLSSQEQKKLIKSSLEAIEHIHEENPEIGRILVTSDSLTLLESASKFSFVYIIPGELVHMDYTEAEDSDKHIKAFLDFFMIGNAKKIYFAEAPGIYGSTFALTASKLQNKPYKTVQINPFK